MISGLINKVFKDLDKEYFLNRLISKVPYR